MPDIKGNDLPLEISKEDQAIVDAAWDTGNEQLRQLMSRLEKVREPWLPEPGEMVGGKIVGIKTVHGGEYGDYPLIEIDTPSAVVQVHAFHTVLRSTLKDLRPQINDLIAIIYRGRVTKKRDMADYTVEVEHMNAPPPAPGNGVPTPIAPPAQLALSEYGRPDDEETF